MSFNFEINFNHSFNPITSFFSFMTTIAANMAPQYPNIEQSKYFITNRFKIYNKCSYMIDENTQTTYI